MNTTIASFPIPSPVDAPAGLGAGGRFPAILPYWLAAAALRRHAHAVVRARTLLLNWPRPPVKAGTIT